MKHESEFYVGYLPMPAGLKASIRRVVAAAGMIAAAAGVILVVGQHPFAASSFEFRDYREFRGQLLTQPYPALMIPGQGVPWLLVAPGKHGAGDWRAQAGREVTLRGERIFRGDDHMIELLPGSLRVAGAGRAPAADVDLGRVEMTGEVVDSKCYFGVMNPGSGKVHRDCAARCISGGIPPALLVRDADGRTQTILLADWKPELLDHIAEPVTIRGRLSRSAGRLILYAE